MKLLEAHEIKEKLKGLQGWELNEKKDMLHKNFQFQNFTSAVCFLNRAAELAELEDHHPDLHLTNYRNLKVVLSTHSAGGLTKKDFLLAAQIEEAHRGEA